MVYKMGCSNTKMDYINLSELLEKMNVASKEYRCDTSDVPIPPVASPVLRRQNAQIIKKKRKSARMFVDIRHLSDRELENVFGAKWEDELFVREKKVVSESECCQAMVRDIETGEMRTCRRKSKHNVNGSMRCTLHKKDASKCLISVTN